MKKSAAMPKKKTAVLKKVVSHLKEDARAERKEMADDRGLAKMIKKGMR